MRVAGRVSLYVQLGYCWHSDGVEAGVNVSENGRRESGSCHQRTRSGSRVKHASTPARDLILTNHLHFTIHSWLATYRTPSLLIGQDALSVVRDLYIDLRRRYVS
jgi:hypothetical protein